MSRWPLVAALSVVAWLCCCCAPTVSADESAAGTVACPAGSYCAPVTCPVGAYCPAGSPAPVPCSTGGYCNATGLPVPYACPAGSYNSGTGATSASACTPCPAGAYCNSTSTAVPVLCAPGTFNGATGQTSCQGCWAGCYCPNTGMTSVTWCTSGRYSAVTRATSSATCQPCPAGGWCPNPFQFYACPAGTHSTVTGATSAATCLPNCASGGYCPSGSGSWTPCPAGTYNGATGATSASACTACSAGTYSNVTGAVSGATCVTCPAGTWCGAGAGLPTPCGPGTYNPDAGATSSSTGCTACSAGTFSGATGATSSDTCSTCPAGTWCGVGAGVPTNCDAGTYSGATGATSAVTCNACDAGRYNPVPASVSVDACLSCPVGTFNGNTGGGSLDSCATCTAGNYCPTLALTAPVLCPVGFICPFNSSLPAPCPAPTICNQTGLTTTGFMGPLQFTPQVFGTYYQPYAVDAPWNSRPVNPILNTSYAIPPNYVNGVRQDANINWASWSTGFFYAAAHHGPMPVWTDNDVDARVARWVTIPHWPPETVPALDGTDRHCDIFDVTTGIIHSFFVLRNSTGRWTCSLYSWTNASLTGWGDGAHYYAGARAAGVVATAGIMRHHEMFDGTPYYPHALAVSLAGNALSRGFVYPATHWDDEGIWVANPNTGEIPEGALLMLPSTFVVSASWHPMVRKIAETLKRYGAYVVDRNLNTPLGFYAEQAGSGSPSSLGGVSWTVMPAQLDVIWQALRRVIGSTGGWVDGLDRPIPSPVAGPTNNVTNLLSLRGPWSLNSDPTGATAPTSVVSFNTWTQNVEFPPQTVRQVVKVSTGFNSVPGWGTLQTNATYLLTVRAVGGATFRLEPQVTVNGVAVGVGADTGFLGAGATRTIVWGHGWWVTLQCQSGALNTFSSVGATFVRIA